MQILTVSTAGLSLAINKVSGLLVFWTTLGNGGSDPLALVTASVDEMVMLCYLNPADASLPNNVKTKLQAAGTQIKLNNNQASQDEMVAVAYLNRVKTP